MSQPTERAGDAEPSRAAAGTADASPWLDQALWLDRLVPLARAFLRLKYFSLEVEGLEHVPREGPVVFAQNHAGWFPLDAFFLSLAVRERLGPGRQPVFAAADAALRVPVLGAFLRRVGALPASWFRRPEKLPAAIQVFGVFPEGVQGNTKPFWQAYRMRDWNRGFVRVAIARGAPIVPVAVLGGEESLPVAWTVTALRRVVGSEFGLPLSVVPLPARWKVVFHAPVDVSGLGKAGLLDAEASTAVARQVQATVQATIDRNVKASPLAQVAGTIGAIVSGRRADRARRR
jgi:1-acyl-sn-glycerol-3-phosphate acyltransferase